MPVLYRPAAAAPIIERTRRGSAAAPLEADDTALDVTGARPAKPPTPAWAEAEAEIQQRPRASSPNGLQRHRRRSR